MGIICEIFGHKETDLGLTIDKESYRAFLFGCVRCRKVLFLRSPKPLSEMLATAKLEGFHDGLEFAGDLKQTARKAVKKRGQKK